MQQVEECMTSRILLTILLFIHPGFEGSIVAQSRAVQGTYRNPALGYSIEIPRGLRAVMGGQAGPERGIGISLPSGGIIAVFGEPNSLEWKTPKEGLAGKPSRPDCDSGAPEIRPVLLGKLQGAMGTLVCGNLVLKSILAFRPGGGPIYWVRLETTRAHESEDDAVFHRIAATFRLISWK